MITSIAFTIVAACQPADPQPAEIYLGLREQILTADAAEFGFEWLDYPSGVWGVLVEFYIDEFPVTLVSLADGTTSLYFGNGGGILGAGTDEKVAASSRLLIRVAANEIVHMYAAPDFPLPEPGNVAFHVLRFDSPATIEVPLDALQSDDHELSHMFSVANDVITQIRLQQENTGPQP